MTPEQEQTLQETVQDTHTAVTRIETRMTERCASHQYQIREALTFMNGNGKKGAKSRLDSLERLQKRAVLGGCGTIGIGSLAVIVKVIWDKI